MSSGGLLLLLGLLTLWAELSPVSGQDRPKFCYLRADPGSCFTNMRAFYYNPDANECQTFIYRGCRGNANRFETKDKCHKACVEKPGWCPQGPQQPPCLKKCQHDWNCPGLQKCCRYGCLSECKDPVYVRLVSPTSKPTRTGTTVRP